MSLGGFSVNDEVSELTDVCVCLGTSVPAFETYEPDHPEFTKYVELPWNRDLFVRQQEGFFAVLERHGVTLHRVAPDPALLWQTYTRDAGFVVGDTLYYCARRGLPDRNGEIDHIRAALGAEAGPFVEITDGRIEGGDVLVHDGMAYVGVSARSRPAGIAELGRHVEVVPLMLGTHVMHLDCKMTILPKGLALIYPPVFAPEDFDMLRKRFRLIALTEAECASMASNVFVINPETIVVDPSHARIIERLREEGLNVEEVDYSEPIALCGSFRCSTMPLHRS